MSRIKGSNTKPERMLMQALDEEAHGRGGSFRIMPQGKVPGTPDFVLPDHKLAVFVHGCFWHGCPDCYRAPKTNVPFWSGKLAANRLRDASVRRKLRKLGWKTLVAWECAINEDADEVARRVLDRAEQKK